MKQLTINALWEDLSHTLAAPLLAGATYPFEALDGLADFIRSLGATLPEDQYTRCGEDVWISKTAVVAESAHIGGPVIIGHNAEVRHCAFIRGSALVGENVVVGNSTELKNCILFDGVQVPHFNYVGDSIFGYKAHMGAGAVTSNVKSDRTPVTIACGEERLQTGRKKCGAMLGDFVEVGCNSVLNPGVLIGPHTTVYPLSSVRGYVPPHSIYKSSGQIVKKH